MIRNRKIAAGTALALLMTAPVYPVPAFAAPVHSAIPAIPQSQTGNSPIILAQASIEELRKRLEEEELTDEERQLIEEQIEALENATGEEAPAVIVDTTSPTMPGTGF